MTINCARVAVLTHITNQRTETWRARLIQPDASENLWKTKWTEEIKSRRSNGETNLQPFTEACDNFDHLMQMRLNKGFIDAINCDTASMADAAFYRMLSTEEIEEFRKPDIQITDEVMAMLDDPKFVAIPAKTPIGYLSGRGKNITWNQQALIPSEALYTAARAIGGDFVITGWRDGDILHAIDLHHTTALSQNATFDQRLEQLRELCEDTENIVVQPYIADSNEKREAAAAFTRGSLAELWLREPAPLSKIKDYCLKA